MKKSIALLVALSGLLFLNSCGSSQEGNRLMTPILVLENETKVSWQTIEDASEYEVDVNGTIYLLTRTYYQVQTYGHYQIKVRALADQMSDKSNSLWSEMLQFDYEDIGLRGVILLDDVRLQLIYGQSYHLNARVAPASNVYFNYTIDNKKIVTINEGILTGVGLGQTNVLVSATGYQPATIIIKVIPLINEVNTISIEEGDFYVLNPIVSPKLSDDQYLSFVCQDPSIAFVGATGIIHAIRPGSTTIDVTSSSGGHKAINIIVNQALPAIVTFIVSTPLPLEEGFSLYLVGSFNEWAIKDSRYIFTPVVDTINVYSLTVTTFEAKMDIEYKYIKGSLTQYSWENYGDSVTANRPIYIPSGPSTINDTISYWQEIIG